MCVVPGLRTKANNSSPWPPVSSLKAFGKGWIRLRSSKRYCRHSIRLNWTFLQLRLFVDTTGEVTVAFLTIYNGEGWFDKAGMKCHAGRTIKLVSSLTLKNPAYLMNWLHLLTCLHPQWTMVFWMAGAIHLNFSFGFVFLAVVILWLILCFYWVLKINSRFGL